MNEQDVSDDIDGFLTGILKRQDGIVSTKVNQIGSATSITLILIIN